MSNPNVPHKITGDTFSAIECNEFQDSIITKYDADTVPLPIASTIALGVVKQGANIVIAGDGTISSTSSPLVPATTTTLGGLIVPAGNLSVDVSGNITLSANPTVTTLNKVTITQPATAATLTIANNKTLTISNSLTFSGTDGSTLNIGAGGTLGTGAFATAYVLPVATTTIGGVKSGGANITIDGAGQISVSGLGSNAFTSTAYAPINAPTITGHPTIEGVTSTGATGTGNLVYSISPNFTVSPTAPTQTALDNSTKLATTAYTDSAILATATYFSTALLSGAGTSGSPYTLNTTTAYTWTGTGVTAYSPSSTGTSTGIFLITPTQTASGNNQTEKAVLINPTYVDGGFTGLAHVPLAAAFNSTSFCISDVRGAGIMTMHASISPTTTNYFINSDNVNITFNAPSSSGNMVFRMNANPAAQIFATTLNMQVTNGTPTDDTINRFQVVGNSRSRAFVASPFSAVPTFGVPTTLSTANVLNGWVQHTGSGSDTFTLPTATALATALPISFVGYIDLVLDNSAASGGTLTLALGSGMTADSVVTGGTTLTMVNGTKGIFRICFTSTTTALVARIG